MLCRKQTCWRIKILQYSRVLTASNLVWNSLLYLYHPASLILKDTDQIFIISNSYSLKRGISKLMPAVNLHPGFRESSACHPSHQLHTHQPCQITQKTSSVFSMLVNQPLKYLESHHGPKSHRWRWPSTWWIASYASWCLVFANEQHVCVNPAWQVDRKQGSKGRRKKGSML